jgi:hypothetical protein
VAHAVRSHFYPRVGEALLDESFDLLGFHGWRVV